MSYLFQYIHIVYTFSKAKLQHTSSLQHVHLNPLLISDYKSSLCQQKINWCGQKIPDVLVRWLCEITQACLLWDVT